MHHLLQIITQELSIASANHREPCFLFNRVSTKMHEQETSLEQQERDSYAYAERKDLHVAYNFRVQETASKEEERHVFNQVVALLKSELINVKHIVFKSADRSSRNRFDKDQLDKLRKHHGVTIHYYSSGKVLHGNSHYTDELQDDIENLFATHFARELSHKIRTAYEYKVFEKKQAPCRTTPLGYLWDKNKKEHLIDPKTEPKVRAIFKAYDASKYSLAAFVNYCNQNNLLPKSGKPWSKGPMEKFLKNPFYCGWFRYKGGIYEGSHTPYFSKEEYDARLARLSSNANGQLSGRRPQLLSKFVRCSDCGRAYIAELQHGRENRGEYVYYKHSCGGGRRERRLRESDLLEAAGEQVERGRFSNQFAAAMKELFSRPMEKRGRLYKKEIRALMKETEQWERRKSKLYDLFTLEEIDQAELVAKRREYEGKIAGLRRRWDALELDDRRVLDKVMQAIELLRDVPVRYLRARAAAGKVEVLKSMASGLVLSAAGELTIKWHRPYDSLMCAEMLAAIENDDAKSLTAGGGNGAKTRKGRENGLESVGVLTPSTPMLGGGRKLNSCGLSPIEQMIVDYKFWMASGESGTM